MPQPRRDATRAARELPGDDVQRALTDAVHEAVSAAAPVFAAPPSRLCALTACVGARVLGTVLDRPYEPVAGSITLRIADAADMPDGAGPLDFQMRADDPRTRGLEFHAWLSAPGEVVDLAAWCYPDWFADVLADPRLGRTPPRRSHTYPAPVWCRPSQLPAGMTLTPSATATGAMRAVAPASVVDLTTQRALAGYRQETREPFTLITLDGTFQL
jgi:hypothetical protein